MSRFLVVVLHCTDCLDKNVLENDQSTPNAHQMSNLRHSQAKKNGIVWLISDLATSNHHFSGKFFWRLQLSTGKLPSLCTNSFIYCPSPIDPLKVGNRRVTAEGGRTDFMLCYTPTQLLDALHSTVKASDLSLNKYVTFFKERPVIV